MIVRIGDLSFRGGYKEVFVSSDKNFVTPINDIVILTEKDLDLKWINRICALAQKTASNQYQADCINSKFVLLYLLFSIRQRLYLKDTIELIGDKSTFDDLQYIDNIQEINFQQLKEFMVVNNYQFKLLKRNFKLYDGKPKIKLRTYPKKEILSLSGLWLLVIILYRAMERRVVVFISKWGKLVSAPLVKKSMKQKFKEVVELNPNSESGCLFYKVRNDSGSCFFVKYGAVLGAEIQDEYVSVIRIIENTECPQQYLLPIFPGSNRKMLIYHFEEKQLSLNQILCLREITDLEFELLLDFLISVLNDLKRCKVIHRDFHLDNILVDQNAAGDIIGYRLIDFGCGCVDKLVNNNKFKEKRKNRYAGSCYRYGMNAWNDAASALLLVMHIKNINYDLHENKIRTLINIMQEEYTAYV